MGAAHGCSGHAGIQHSRRPRDLESRVRPGLRSPGEARVDKWVKSGGLKSRRPRGLAGSSPAPGIFSRDRLTATISAVACSGNGVMEASALTTAGHGGLLARRSPLLRLQSDDRLVALIRDGHDRAFEVLFDRYQARLLSFCRHMVGCNQDAEDLLQDVFVAAHMAMLADERPITARPWLYRIARNRCLNHLRKPVAEGQDTMDVHPYAHGATTFERVQRREELRTVVADVQELPETQRSALVLREIDGLTYTEIAQAMGVTLAAVKSLLVRARMALAEASEARILVCDDVRLELAEAAEGLGKVSGPARRHVKDCTSCRRFRGQLRSTTRSLAGLAPFGMFAVVGKFFASKLAGAGGGSAGSASGTAGSAGGAGGAAGGGAGAAGAGGAGAPGGPAGARGALLGGAPARRAPALPDPWGLRDRLAASPARWVASPRPPAARESPSAARSALSAASWAPRPPWEWPRPRSSPRVPSA